MTPWPLATDAPLKVLAWPDYNDRADLRRLLERFARPLAERGDVALCLRHDPGVDPDAPRCIAALTEVAAEVLGDADGPAVLLVDDPIAEEDRRRLGAAVHAAIWLESSAQPARASFLASLGLPMCADPAALGRVLPPPIRILTGMVRPFTLADLAEVPTGWRVGPPDYVGIGTSKAGTTWWSQLIEAHPSVVPNRLRQKELHQFCHFDVRQPDAAAVQTYRQAFAAPPGAVCGEFSATYLAHPLAMGHLLAAAPEARLLVLLRNPVDRTLSSLAQLREVRSRYMGLDADRHALYRDFSLFPEAVSASRVSDAMAQLLEVVDPARLLVLQLEQCRAQPAVQLQRTFAFLGVGPFVPRGLHRRVNARPRRPADAAQRARLAALFADEVQRLSQLLPDIDRSLWPDFDG